MNCCQQNPVYPELKADRIPLSNISTNGYLITHSIPVFCESDIGKVIVVYDSVIIPWDTLYPDQYKGSAASLTALNALPSSDKVDGYIRNALDNTPNIFYRYSTDGVAGWYPLKVRQSKACEIKQFLSPGAIKVDFNFDILQNLNGTKGTDNFKALQDSIYLSIDQGKTLLIPDGDYMILFSDVYDGINDSNSKQRIRLFKEPGSSSSISGESKDNTRLFYEYDTEYSYSVYGLGLINQDTSGESSYQATVSNIQIVGPRYKHKLQELYIDNYRPASYGISTIGQYIDLNINNIIIDGEEYRCMAEGVDNFGDGVNYFPNGFATVNISNSIIRNCYLIGIGEFGDHKVLNASNTVIENIGLLPEDSYTGRVVGVGFYPHPENSFRFMECTFRNIPRHFMGVNSHGIIFNHPVYYQEFNSCLFENSGHGVIDPAYPKTRFLNCQFVNCQGISLTNSCEISNCSFTRVLSLPGNDLGWALDVSTQSYPEDTRYLVTVNNCSFHRQRPLAAHNVGTNPNSFHFEFNSCSIYNEAYTDGNQFEILGGQSIKLQNSVFRGAASSVITLGNTRLCELINNTFNMGVAKGVVTIDGNSNPTILINNNFNLNHPIEIGNGSATMTIGNQISGYDNYFARWDEFNNVIATLTPILTQKLLGRSGFYPNTIELISSSFTGFLSDVNFNFDFYKIGRDIAPSTDININFIAFNSDSPSYRTTHGICLFTGNVKLMAIHDVSVDGDIIIKDNAGSFTNGNVFMPSGDYTMVPFEVIEFYYDPDTMFWNMLK